jgi:hypothetical protein
MCRGMRVVKTAYDLYKKTCALFTRNDVYKYIFFCIYIIAGVFSYIAIFKPQPFSWFPVGKGLQTPIRSDGAGYYAYLPALFIYKDITLKKDDTKDQTIRNFAGNPVEGRETRVMKYPIGTAILQTPFFFLATTISRITGNNIDGLNKYYQYIVGLAGFIYGFIGLLLLWSLLQKTVASKIIFISFSALLYGTNLFHYQINCGTYSHAYSFFLFCVLLFLLNTYYSLPSLKKSILTGAVCGLLTIVRPTNVIIGILCIGYGIYNKQTLKERVMFIRNKWVYILVTLFCAFLVVMIQLWYWKAATGSFRHYSYGDEGFSFLSPHLIDYLFSFRKGLFVWSPVLLPAFISIFLVKKENLKLHYSMIFYIVLHIYIAASWWSWWYGCSFSQRSFTEVSAVLMIPFCLFTDKIQKTKWRRLFNFMLFTLIIRNIFHMFRYWSGILPCDGASVKHFFHPWLF